jgi:hypothetical protein
MLRAFLLLLFLSFAAPAAAQTAQEQAALQQAGARGRLLFEVDRAGWVATDDVLKRLGSKRDVPLKGWVVELDALLPHSYIVTFFGDGPSGPVAWYVGKVRDNKIVSGALLPAEGRVPLTPAQLRITQALQIAGAEARADETMRPCTGVPFNAAVLPAANPDAPLDVYLLTPAVQNGVYPFGGHFLVRVGADGKVVSKRRFTKSCLNMEAPGDTRQRQAVGLVIGHLLDPTPTEIHVFLSIWTRKPVFVGTSDGRLWSVEEDRIRLVKP